MKTLDGVLPPLKIFSGAVLPTRCRTAAAVNPLVLSVPVTSRPLSANKVDTVHQSPPPTLINRTHVIATCILRILLSKIMDRLHIESC